MPGVPFHLTSRIQGHEPVFVGLESSIVGMFERAERFSDARIIAHSVMPNHLHLIVSQGQRPLAHLMQPLLRRIAWLIARSRKWEGHVFERRYRDSACMDADYLRHAIAYVHLNAVRAKLCPAADDYLWSSHGRLCAVAASDRTTGECKTSRMLRLFASNPGQSLAGCLANYRLFLQWRLDCDRARAEHGDCETRLVLPDCPVFREGDSHWALTFGRDTMIHRPTEEARGDLSDIAKRLLSQHSPELSLERLRSGESGRMVVHARRRFIARAIDSGYRTGAVARYLNISDSAVSRSAPPSS